MTMTTATFRIDGRHYCDLARGLVLENEWRKGLNLLVDAFEGMTHDIAFLILKGTHVLVSQKDDITLIEEINEDYQNEVREIYCQDRFFNNGQLYQFEQLIEQREIQADIYTRNLTYNIPDVEEYVQRYMLPETMSFFDVTVNAKRFRCLLATKLDNNALPLWLTHEDFCRTAKQFSVKYMPQSESIGERIVRNALESKEKSTPFKESDLYITGRKLRAIEVAKDYGFQSPEEFSNDVRTKVLKAIDDRGVEWRELHVNNEGINEVIKYPYQLALNYALSRTALSSLSPNWIVVSPDSIKQDNDFRIHSDLWLALGNSFDGMEYIYSTRENIILTELVRHLQKEVFPAGEFVVLNSAGLKTFKGTVVTPDSKKITKNDILVIPTAGPEFELIAKKAGLVIAETGSKLAHLVIVGREFGLPLVRIDNACKLFKKDMVVTLDFNTATLTIEK